MATQKELIERLEYVLSQLKESDLTPYNLRRIYRRVWSTERIVIEQVEPARLRAIEEKLDYLINKSEQRVCHYDDSGGQEPQDMQFLVSRGAKGRDQGNNKLGRWLKDAKNITIVDPYFFDKGSYKDVLDYNRALEFILPPTVQKLEVFYNPDYHNKEVGVQLNKDLQTKNVSRTYVASKNIHDRVWIKERKSDGAMLAKVIGCSFHNIGKKPTYILDLPSFDLDEYMKDLKHIREESESVIAHDID